MAHRYSSIREKAHLHLLAIKVYRWFVMIHSLSRRKTWDIVYVVLMQIKSKSYSSLLKKPIFSIWVESWSALLWDSTPRCNQNTTLHKHEIRVLVVTVCIYITWSLIWTSKEWKNKGILTVYYLWMRSCRGWAIARLGWWSGCQQEGNSPRRISLSSWIILQENLSL